MICCDKLGYSVGLNYIGESEITTEKIISNLSNFAHPLFLDSVNLKSVLQHVDEKILPRATSASSYFVLFCIIFF